METNYKDAPEMYQPGFETSFSLEKLKYYYWLYESLVFRFSRLNQFINDDNFDPLDWFIDQENPTRHLNGQKDEYSQEMDVGVNAIIDRLMRDGN